MKFDCTENAGDKIEFDLFDGELIVTIKSTELNCTLVACLSEEDTEKAIKTLYRQR
tara:strand:+ start:26351 stop:26518 length:168 start_codon:yes stop_codon:yes gene_type:complete